MRNDISQAIHLVLTTKLSTSKVVAATLKGFQKMMVFIMLVVLVVLVVVMMTMTVMLMFPMSLPLIVVVVQLPKVAVMKNI
jgi:hypothetical protein